jgi:hypothetical protein
MQVSAQNLRSILGGFSRSSAKSLTSHEPRLIGPVFSRDRYVVGGDCKLALEVLEEEPKFGVVTTLFVSGHVAEVALFQWFQ